MLTPGSRANGERPIDVGGVPIRTQSPPFRWRTDPIDLVTCVNGRRPAHRLQRECISRGCGVNSAVLARTHGGADVTCGPTSTKSVETSSQSDEVETLMDTYHILVPVDFSDCSNAAQRCAFTLARAQASVMVTLLHVNPGIVPIYDEQLGILEPNRLATIMKLRAAEHVTEHPEVPIEAHVVYGEPSRKITEFAVERAVDLIVMGTHGRTGLHRLLMGSVAEATLRTAPCPVLFVKETVPSPTNHDSGAQPSTTQNPEVKPRRG